MTKYLFAGLMASLFFVAGCAEKQQQAAAPAPAAVEKPSAENTAVESQPANSAEASTHSAFIVKEVHVDIDASKVDGERTAMANQYDLTGRLESGTRDLLQGNSHFDGSQGDSVVQITVTNFRLRSGASAFWLGVMAGADKIAVDVKVTQNGKLLKSYQTDVSTALGGMALPAPSQRINRMATELSRRIVAQIE